MTARSDADGSSRKDHLLNPGSRTLKHRSRMNRFASQSIGSESMRSATRVQTGTAHRHANGTDARLHSAYSSAIDIHASTSICFGNRVRPAGSTSTTTHKVANCIVTQMKAKPRTFPARSLSSRADPSFELPHSGHCRARCSTSCPQLLQRSMPGSAEVGGSWRATKRI